MAEFEGKIIRGMSEGKPRPIAGGSGESGESKSAYRRAVELCFDAQDHARRVAVIEEMMAAGALSRKPRGRRRGR